MQKIIKKFSHLKIHTQYSICEGTIKIDDLKEHCKKNQIQSIGISDTTNLCGALEFSESISKSGTQPIIGTQINLRATTVNTLFGSNSTLLTTLTVVGIDSGARLTVPVTITKQATT